MGEKLPINVTVFSSDDLAGIVREAQKELRERAIESLLKERCECDRYTCYRCQRLQGLGYDFRTHPRATSP